MRKAGTMNGHPKFLGACPRCGNPTLFDLMVCGLFAKPIDDQTGGSVRPMFPTSPSAPMDLEYCNWCAVSFDPTELEPAAHRHDDAWSVGAWPAQPVATSLARLWGQVADRGVIAVTTEATLASMLPEGIVHDRWWDAAPGILIVDSESQVIDVVAGDPSHFALETRSLDDLVPATDLADRWRGNLERSIRHLRSRLDPVGVVAVVTPQSVEVVTPAEGVVDEALLESDPPKSSRRTEPDPSTKLEQQIDELLASIASDVESDVPTSERIRVVWGVPHVACFMLESRSRLLAEAWTAVHEHDVWAEVELAVAPPTAEWLRSLLTEFLHGLEYGDLAPSTALSLFRREIEESPEMWPYPNGQDEFEDFDRGLNDAGREMLGEAFHEEVVMIGSSMTDGLITSIDDPERLAKLLSLAAVDCRRDEDLIRAALGPWT